MIYTETITDKMKEVSNVIFDNFNDKYYLAGGTALALQIGHRESVDLDYFINENIDTLKLKDLITEKFKDKQIQFVFEDKNTLWSVVDGVKISFISRFDPLMKEVIIVDSFRLASIEDLVVMKLNAICGREEYKDYFDLGCLSIITDIRLWVIWWQRVYINSDPISFIIALANTNNIIKIPLSIHDKFKDININEVLSDVVFEIKKFLL